MNKRDFLKSTAALAAAPAILSRTTMAAAKPAERIAAREARRHLGPVPAYVYDSEKRTMRFTRADTGSFGLLAYMAA